MAITRKWKIIWKKIVPHENHMHDHNTSCVQGGGGGGEGTASLKAGTHCQTTTLAFQVCPSFSLYRPLCS